MRKLILTIGILLSLIAFSQINAWAYSIVWGIPSYSSNTWAESLSYDDDDYFDQNYNSSNVSELNSSIATTPYANAYASAFPKPGELESASLASSSLPDENVYGYAYSNVHFSNTFSITGGAPGEIVPVYASANLTGRLENSVGEGDDDYAYSDVSASAGISGIGNYYFYDWLEWGGLKTINDSYLEPFNLEVGTEYEAFADLYTFAETWSTGEAASVFSPDSLTFDVRLADNGSVVPEPATFSLLGLGLLGLLARKKPRA